MKQRPQCLATHPQMTRHQPSNPLTRLLCLRRMTNAHQPPPQLTPSGCLQQLQHQLQTQPVPRRPFIECIPPRPKTRGCFQLEHHPPNPTVQQRPQVRSSRIRLQPKNLHQVCIGPIFIHPSLPRFLPPSIPPSSFHQEPSGRTPGIGGGRGADEESLQPQQGEGGTQTRSRSNPCQSPRVRPGVGAREGGTRAAGTAFDVVVEDFVLPQETGFMNPDEGAELLGGREGGREGR